MKADRAAEAGKVFFNPDTKDRHESDGKTLFIPCQDRLDSVPMKGEGAYFTR